jgi:nucleotide-binding universal stress UspA family protein
MITLKTILAPTDFSESSKFALNHAKALAERFEASLHLLHVLPDPHAQAWSIEAAGVPVDELQTRWGQEAKQRLDEALTAEEHRSLRTVTETRVGHPFLEIIRYAKAHDVDLIVIGTHGRGAIEHMLLGSVAEKVVRKAPCPVLTVREGQPSFELP